MQRLDQLEAQSVYILREAYANISPLGMLWSLGKDSNAMIWLCRKAFGGHVPFPVVHLDTDKEFDRVYEFRDTFSKEWGLNLQVYKCPPIEEVDPTLPPSSREAGRKTEGLRRLIQEHAYRGIIAGIRRDEQATRAKERIFSPRDENMQWDFRDQPLEFWDQFKTDFPPESHIRIHPLMNWTEVDIWRYIQRENIPVVSLYFAENGWRYRSLGEYDITHPVRSDASTIEGIIAELETTKAPERAGRAMDHESEDAFERLRTSGYM